MKPSVGRIVHYVSYGTPGGEYASECRAAVVTETSLNPELPDVVSMFVMNPEGIFLSRGVPYHEGDPGHDHTGEQVPALSYRGGTWHWPERVPE
jgi:hypothetical protein